VGEVRGVEWPLNDTARYDRAWWTEESAPVGRGPFWALLFVHDAIMRDGAAASGLYLTEFELRWAVVGCHYLGFDAVGDLLECLRDASASPVVAAVIDSEYRRRLPDDAPFLAALRRRLAERQQPFRQVP
jgi:hypothetical protein